MPDTAITTETKIRVLVVDDSSVMRIIISDIVSRDSEIEVIDVASNGKDALTKTIVHQPDVILMDMNMGEYNGLYGVKQIMNERATPIIMLSSVGNTNLSPILETLHHGAFDYVNKPVKNSTRIADIQPELIRKIKAAHRVDASKLQGKSAKSTSNHAAHVFDENMRYEAIVVGSSTGGPTALEKLIDRLPSNLNIPVVIAQHMPEAFVPSFAERLNRRYPLQVKVGEMGTKLQAGHVYIAPGNRNMIIKKGVDGKAEIGFTPRKFKEYNHPSVNALMLSAAEVFGQKVIGVILTGMGRDGAEGIAKIKEKGGFTVAQDEASSVVFGMPREAIKTGKVDRVVPIDQMGGFLVSCLC